VLKIKKLKKFIYFFIIKDLNMNRKEKIKEFYTPEGGFATASYARLW
jgi:hypothetical protein